MVIPNHFSSTGHLVLFLELLLWPVAKHCTEARAFADALGVVWTVDKARPIIEERCGGLCENPKCFNEAGDPHHVFFRSRHAGNFFIHHPGNLWALCRECHDGIHAGDLPELDAFLKEQAREALPPWFEEATKTQTIEAPAKKKKAGMCENCERFKAYENGFCKNCFFG